MRDKKLEIAEIASKPWGAAFLREMDLVIAQGVIWSFNGGGTLYNDLINHRVADFCRHLDGDYAEAFLGTIHVPPDPQDPWKRLPEAQKVLIGKPRGTWAIFEMDGKYDAMMSDGVGGLGHPPGNSFVKTSPHVPDLNPRTLYAGTLSWAVYDRRKDIEKQILAHSAKVAEVKPGTVVRDKYMGGHQQNRIEFTRELPNHFAGGVSAYEATATRRGVRKKTFVLEAGRFLDVFGIPAVLPDDLVPTDGVDRTTSLHERRTVVAQEAWNRYAAENQPPVSPRNTSGPFMAEGDLFTRNAYVPAGSDVAHAGTFYVQFAPGGTEVRMVELRLDAPEPFVSFS